MKPPEKILVFRQSSLGDVVLTLPILQKLRESFPQAQIDYFTKSRFAPVVQHHPTVGRTHTFDSKADFIETLKQLRKCDYDLVIDLQANFRSYLLRLFLIPVRVLRYRKRRLARQMVVRKPHLKLRVDHTLNAYFAALKKLGIAGSYDPPEMTLPQEAIDFADSFIKSPQLHNVETLVAICPGARHHEKKWPQHEFREVARKLLENTSIGVIVVTLSRDELPPDLGLTDSRVVPARDLEILKVAALLSRCRLALTNDSGLMHLANAVGTPVLAIFGPTNPRLGFSPTLPGSRVLCDDVFCSPCSLHGEKKCYQPEKYCFQKITAERVHNQLAEMLRQA